MKQGRIIKALSGFYYVESQDKVYQCRARGQFRNKNLTPLVGDFCDFQIENEHEGYIMNLHARHNALVRPPICNIDQAFLVFSAKEPQMNMLFLNRFLLQIESLNIFPIIVISKTDLIQLDEFKTLMLPYKKAGYTVLYVSSENHEGLDDIRKMIQNKVSVFTGQSGVGKSSLLNALDIHLNIETNEISKSLGRGKHTTRHVELLKMYGGYVADTPGFSSLELQLEPLEVASAYHDFSKLSSQCKFRGCLHDSEPHCAVKKAVEEGKISKERYEHYKIFLQEARELKERKYD